MKEPNGERKLRTLVVDDEGRTEIRPEAGTVAAGESGQAAVPEQTTNEAPTVAAVEQPTAPSGSVDEVPLELSKATAPDFEDTGFSRSLDAAEKGVPVSIGMDVETQQQAGTVEEPTGLVEPERTGVMPAGEEMVIAPDAPHTVIEGPVSPEANTFIIEPDEPQVQEVGALARAAAAAPEITASNVATEQPTLKVVPPEDIPTAELAPPTRPEPVRIGMAGEGPTDILVGRRMPAEPQPAEPFTQAEDDFFSKGVPKSAGALEEEARVAEEAARRAAEQLDQTSQEATADQALRAADAATGQRLDSTLSNSGVSRERAGWFRRNMRALSAGIAAIAIGTGLFAIKKYSEPEPLPSRRAELIMQAVDQAPAPTPSPAVEAAPATPTSEPDTKVTIKPGQGFWHALKERFPHATNEALANILSDAGVIDFQIGYDKDHPLSVDYDENTGNLKYFVDGQPTTLQQLADTGRVYSSAATPKAERAVAAAPAPAVEPAAGTVSGTAAERPPVAAAAAAVESAPAAPSALDKAWDSVNAAQDGMDNLLTYIAESHKKTAADIDELHFSTTGELRWLGDKTPITLSDREKTMLTSAQRAIQEANAKVTEALGIDASKRTNKVLVRLQPRYPAERRNPRTTWIDSDKPLTELRAIDEKSLYQQELSRVSAEPLSKPEWRVARKAFRQALMENPDGIKLGNLTLRLGLGGVEARLNNLEGAGFFQMRGDNLEQVVAYWRRQTP